MNDNRNFIVKLGEGVYYSKDHAWKPQPKHKATWLNRSDANSVCARMRHPKIGYPAEIEERVIDEIESSSDQCS
jgi:hypothetical protein